VAAGNNRTTCRLNLESAIFLNGANLPRELLLNAEGLVSGDDSGAGIARDVGDVMVIPVLVNSHDHLEFSFYSPLGEPPYADVDEWARDVHVRDGQVVSRIEEIPRDLRRYWGLLKNLSWGVTTVMDHGEPQSRPDCDMPVRTVRPFRHVHRGDKKWAWLEARCKRGAGPLVFHIGEGTSDGVARRSRKFLRRMGGHGPFIGVHGISLQQEDARHLDALVWCPESNLFLFNQTADIESLKGATEILFGTDATVSAKGSIWDHLRTARSCGGLSDSELLDSVTTTATRVWELDHSGDFIIASRRHADPWESLFQITAADIHAVVSQHRVVLMSEHFFNEVALDSWHKKYAAMTIGGNAVRLYDPSMPKLARLADTGRVPLTVQANT